MFYEHNFWFCILIFVRNGNINLEFNEKDAPKELKVSPETFALAEAGDAGTITVETDTTDKYGDKSFNVTIIGASLKTEVFRDAP